MKLLHFQNPRLASFVAAFTNHLQFVNESRTDVATTNDVELHLLSRLNDGRSAALRFSTGTEDYWMVTGQDHRDLAQTASRLGRFLTPTYGTFEPHAVDMLRFEPEKNNFHQLAAELALVGYYRFKTESRFRNDVLATLQTWMNLEAQIPSLVNAPLPTYRELSGAFRSAVATSDWDAAEQALDKIADHRLTTADNTIFLRIQLLEAQEKWDALWEDSNFGGWARQRIPRAIRLALLTAFHHSVLLPKEQEQNWVGAHDAFRSAQGRLGRLLESRLQNTSLPVVRVFAYQAVTARDYALATALRTTLPDETVAAIAPILDLLPEEEPVPDGEEHLAPEILSRILLFESDLDSARDAIRGVADSSMRATLLTDLAERTRDIVDAEEALTAITDLHTWEYNDLLAKKPYLKRHLEILESLLGTDDPATMTVQTWSAWLAAITGAPDGADVEESLDQLILRSDERLWDPPEVRLIAERVSSIVVNEDLVTRAVVRRGLASLGDVLLLDSDFPRLGETYSELYDAVYTYILESGPTNDPVSRKLIRYAEAILMNNPDRVFSVSDQLQRWFSTPRPVLLDRQLDALELVCDYGLDGRTLVAHVRAWADALLSFTTDIDESTVRAWAEFAAIIEAGDDIVTRLRKHKTVAESSFTDVVAGLPNRFRIAIFTLRPKSADRVRSILLALNSQLDVQISEEKDLSPRVKHLAASADLPVVITTCITHALTYGIGPHLRVEPARPDSSGSTSIMRAIGQALKS